VALARDESAASPLVVITTFVLVAVMLTIIVYAVAFDRPEPGAAFVVVREKGALSFEVTQTSGGLAWEDVTLRFLDRAGADLAGSYLQVPSGAIEREDRVAVVPLPPAGTYLFLVFHGGEELSRLAVTV
jgi:hypothetical protein